MKTRYGKTSFACGINWPDGQIIPHFTKPEKLDGIFIKELPRGEATAFTLLQGIVNKIKTRMIIIESGVGEGSFAWIEASKLDVHVYETEERYDLLKKYIGEASGVILYSMKNSKHYRNAAITVAGVLNALPILRENYEEWQKQGINLPVLYDMTELEYTTPIEIYTWLYENFWDKCNHRLLLSMPCNDPYHLYDLSGAVASASVYLDCRIPEEKAVFERYLDDMEAGNGIVMGWYTTERSGISTVASHGLSTLPADFFANATVFAGFDHYINKRAVPKMPTLENKIYLMLVISDGDNIQYNEHAMRVMWDRIEANGEKGLVPLNWTISPSLPDVAPNLMNYYYSKACDSECFVSGPSGLGYALIVNTLDEPGAPCLDFEKNSETFKEYVKLTDRYLEKSGIRAVTIWDNATKEERDIYTSNTDYLRGLTVHVWCDRETNTSSVNNDIRVQQLVPCYCGDIKFMTDSIIRQAKEWDGKSPMFLASQINVWDNITPTSLKKMLEELNTAYNGKVECVRADHYFEMWNKANGIPYEITMTNGVKAFANGEDISYILNGTPSKDIYTAKEKGASCVDIDLGGAFDLSKIVLRHAKEANLCSCLNTCDYTVSVSADGNEYKKIAEVIGNTDDRNYIKFAPVKASFIRINISDPGKDGFARIANIEVYGK